jgi:site-specific DNA-methyltransferase (adenine-specific)
MRIKIIGGILGNMDKQTRRVMFSSERQDWATPQEVFDKLNKEFNFTLDPCCSEKTAKCKKFYTIKEDGLKQSWEKEVVFMNPPFGREQAQWIKKGYEEWKIRSATIVFLIPARTDTIAFHKYIYPYAELRFIKGRLKFINPSSTTPKEKWTPAPFPSMICILRGKQ